MTSWAPSGAAGAGTGGSAGDVAPRCALESRVLGGPDRWRHWNLRAAWFRLTGMALVLWKPLNLFRAGRVPVQIHPTFLIYPAGIVAWRHYAQSGGRGLLRAVVLLLVFSSSLLAHEFAHVLVSARCFGIKTRRVILIPFGALAQLESMPRSAGEIWIAFAGPLASLSLAGIFWLALCGMGPPVRHWMSGESWLFELSRVLRAGYLLNLTMGAFNLLPCFPMDGGRVLRSSLAVLIGRISPRHSGQAFVIATRISVRYVAWVAALAMMAWTIFYTHFWTDLVLFTLLIVAAEGEYWLLRCADHDPSGMDARQTSED